MDSHWFHSRMMLEFVHRTHLLPFIMQFYQCCCTDREAIIVFPAALCIIHRRGS